MEISNEWVRDYLDDCTVEVLNNPVLDAETIISVLSYESADIIEEAKEVLAAEERQAKVELVTECLRQAKKLIREQDDKVFLASKQEGETLELQRLVYGKD
jgi:hypothetical protein